MHYCYNKSCKHPVEYQGYMFYNEDWDSYHCSSCEQMKYKCRLALPDEEQEEDSP